MVHIVPFADELQATRGLRLYTSDLRDYTERAGYMYIEKYNFV